MIVAGLGDRIMLSNTTDTSFITTNTHSHWYNNNNNNK